MGARIGALRTGGSALIDADFQHIYSCAEDIGAKVSVVKNKDGTGYRVTKLYSATDTLQDLIIGSLMVFCEPDGAYPFEEIQAVSAEISRKIKEYYKK